MPSQTAAAFAAGRGERAPGSAGMLALQLSNRPAENIRAAPSATPLPSSSANAAGGVKLLEAAKAVLTAQRSSIFRAATDVYVDALRSLHAETRVARPHKDFTCARIRRDAGQQKAPQNPDTRYAVE